MDFVLAGCVKYSGIQVECEGGTCAEVGIRREFTYLGDEFCAGGCEMNKIEFG